MRKLVTILFIALSIAGYAQFSPQSKKITEKFFPEMEDFVSTTPAFQKEKGFTNYEELMSFISELEAAHSDVFSHQIIGQSQKGRDIPMITISNKKNGDEKLRFWIQAGIHGNEPASTEGILHLIERMLNDSEHRKVLDNIDFGIVPMANIDGFVKQNRYAANGLDLNRDQTKLNIHESPILKKAFTDFEADVAMDFHEYRPYRRDYGRLGDWGLTSPFDVMFLYSGNLNVPVNLREFTKEEFVIPAKAKMESYGLRTQDYFSSAKFFGEIQINRGSVNSRSSATSYALTNCVSTLIEVRGVGLNRTSFKRRTFTTYQIAWSYINSAIENMARVKEEIAIANADMDRPVVVDSKKKMTGEPIQMIDLATNELINYDFVVRDGWGSEATLTRQRPDYYIVLAGNEPVIERLHTLGINTEKTSIDQTIDVEQYRVISYEKDHEEYEGVYRQDVKTEIVKESIYLPAGSYFVPMDQRHANLAVEVLEPEATNSFVTFDVIPTSLGATLPVYRHFNPDKL